MILLVVTLWVLCGLGGAGFSFAYFQGRFPNQAEENWREDLGGALLSGIVLGLVWLLVCVCESGFGKYGWRLWPEERP